MILHFIYLQQNLDQITKKIESAPNKAYEIGVAIGAFLPFVILVIIAYLLFKNAKNKDDFNS